MLVIEVAKVDKLLELSQELKIISYLQRLVNYDINAKCLNISKEVQEITADYLISLNAKTVDNIFEIIRKEDFTVSKK